VFWERKWYNKEMVSSIPQLIPVENSPDKPQESINIGDTLE
jgi:hypothetical protein